MESNNIIAGVIIENTNALTLEEFCYATKADKEVVIKMINYQLIHPQGATPSEWRFDSVSLRRGRIASSFYHDLEVNMQGVALALDLLDQIEELKHQLRVFKKM